MQPRQTIQKMLIHQAVSTLGSHPSPEEVWAFITKQCPSVSKGTVYRNLNHLAESGLLLKVETPDGADRFDHNCHMHYHIQCEKCKRVFDVDMEYQEDIHEKIGDKKGFEFLSHSIIFKGLCPECAEVPKGSY